MSRLTIPVETLAKQDPPSVAMSQEELDNVANLAMLLSVAANERGGLLRDPNWKPFTALPEEKRADMRRGVHRVVQALHMLGWLDAT
jgi:hypothetical protein